MESYGICPSVLAYHTYHKVLKVHPCCGLCHKFQRLNNILLRGYITLCFSFIRRLFCFTACVHHNAPAYHSEYLWCLILDVNLSHTVPRFLAKHCSSWFCEGVLCEINIQIGGLSTAGCPPSCGRDTSHQLKAWVEQKGRISLEKLGFPCLWAGAFSFPWTQLRSALSCFQSCRCLGSYTIGSPGF